MRRIVLGLLATTLVTGLATGCTAYVGPNHPHADWSRYDYDRPDPSYGGYDADRYYREDAERSHERQLANDDRVYRGHDGRYYCRRSDGSTGLVVGAIAGGVLGEIIAPGGSDTVGVVLGALAGHEIDRSQGIRCR